jgi:DNA-binding FadR family transcriptional regulator
MGELTERVEAAIRGMIERGEYQAGDKLPSERDLAVQLSAGRTTIRLVLTKLTAQGLVEAQHGRGYFVTDKDAT